MNIGLTEKEFYYLYSGLETAKEMLAMGLEIDAYDIMRELSHKFDLLNEKIKQAM